MKIKNLIEKLKKLPQDAEIATYDYDVNKIVEIKQLENRYGKEDLRKIGIKKADYILCIGNQHKNFK
ncbi:hypothetical protein FDC26_14200 [Clostridium botulinum]|uniref:hypothetical protein n=1 Tax=unclassified Clostridium TaxID=2614128 RepID=UPI0013C569E1|nr:MULTISPECIES: hypothetical protein [unclassified Clostridium]NFM11393.1 hypothetical protein [Clostridium botulinum]NFN78001.1 hypothetical protein [Clostridium botulinum]NFO75053.1 hypothetical protein [Clostridium botulinum]NFO78811.1 hypothetical protein [Clostridium botulinum]NFP05733.1 hypothetical protein [Clostridium botulinum]